MQAFEIGHAHEGEVYRAVVFSDARPILIEGDADHPVEDVQGSRIAARGLGAGSIGLRALSPAVTPPLAVHCAGVRCKRSFRSPRSATTAGRPLHHETEIGRCPRSVGRAREVAIPSPGNREAALD